MKNYITLSAIVDKESDWLIVAEHVGESDDWRTYLNSALGNGYP